MWYTQGDSPTCPPSDSKGLPRMFWGEYSHQLDKKGRLIIPARYRNLLNEKAILTRGMDENLVIYPASTWETVIEQ